MRTKFFIAAVLFFIAGCGTNSTPQPSGKIDGGQKIKVESLSCNSPGSGAYITESLKQELQKRGYNITEDSPDIVISGAITVTGYYHTTPEVSTSVIYIANSSSQEKASLLYKGEWGFSKNPKDFAKITAKQISEQLQKKP